MLEELVTKWQDIRMPLARRDLFNSGILVVALEKVVAILESNKFFADKEFYIAYFRKFKESIKP